jgi:hypothetical protein
LSRSNSMNKSRKTSSKPVTVGKAKPARQPNPPGPSASSESRRQDRSVFTKLASGRTAGDVVCEGRELVAQLSIPTGGIPSGVMLPGSVVQLGFHTPNSSATFPPTLANVSLGPNGTSSSLRVASLAKYWEKYRVISCKLEYVSSASRNQAGSIAIGVNPDPYDTVATNAGTVVTLQQWTGRENTAETYVGHDVVMDVPVDPQEHLFCEDNRVSIGDDYTQLRLSSFGTMGVMAIETQPAGSVVPLGNVYIRYKVEFMVPRLPQVSTATAGTTLLLEQVGAPTGTNSQPLDPALGAFATKFFNGLTSPAWWDDTNKILRSAADILYTIGITGGSANMQLNNTSSYSATQGSVFTTPTGAINALGTGFLTSSILALGRLAGSSLPGYLNMASTAGFNGGGQVQVTNASLFSLSQALARGPVRVVYDEDIMDMSPVDMRLVRDWQLARLETYPQYGGQFVRAFEGNIDCDLVALRSALRNDLASGESTAISLVPDPNADLAVEPTVTRTVTPNRR